MKSVFRATSRHGPERITMGRSVGGIAVTVHAYRLQEVLVDAGPPALAERLVEHLQPDLPARAALTHHHPDHAGGATRLAEAGVEVLAHEGALAPLWQVPEPSSETVERWGRPEPVDADCLEGTVPMDGDGLEVVPTPGHTDDHVAFYESDRGWVFTGDAYIGPRVALGPEEDLAQLLDSYRRLCDLEAERMFPAHGAVVKDPTRTLSRTIEHFDGLGERALRLRGEGMDRDTLVDELFEARTGRYTEGRFTHANLVDELLRVYGGGGR